MLLSKMKQFKLNPSNVIIDELGLVGNSTLEILKVEYPHIRVYCLGDELQL